MRTFEQMIEDLELAIEEPLQSIDAFRSDKAGVIYDRMTGLQNAIDDWRQGQYSGTHDHHHCR